MIDQSAIGLLTVHTSHSGGKRDKAGASLDHGKNSGSFGDMVAQAGKKHAGKFDAEVKDDPRTLDMTEAADHPQAADKTTIVGKISALDVLTIDAEAPGTEIAEANLLPDDSNDEKFETVKDPKSGMDVKAVPVAKTGIDAKAGTDTNIDHQSMDDVEPRTASASTAGNEPKLRVSPQAEDMPEIADKPENSNEHKVHTEPKTGNESRNLKDTVIDTGRKAEPKVEITPEIGIESDVAPAAKNTDAASQPTEGRVRLSAGFQHLMRTTADGGILRSADDRITPAKGEKVEAGKQRGVHKGELPDAGEAKVKSPAEELRALLGLEPEETAEVEAPVDNIVETPVAKTSVSGDDQPVDSKTAKPEPVIDVALQAAGSDAAEAVQAAPMQHAAFKATPEKSPFARLDTETNSKQPEIDVEKIRVVSNDGKARSVDIELSKSNTDDNTAPSTGGKMDFVTVLESRRYLGFTTDSNAGALTNAIKSDSSWAQVIQSVNNGSHHTATEVNTLKLQLNPENLGNMTAQLRLKGEELSIELKVETVEAYRQLSNDHDGILKALKDQGFTIDQVSIQLSPSARSDSGQNAASQNNGNQQGNGQAPQEGQGDNARQRNESERRNSGNQNNWMGNDRTSSFSDSGGGSDDTGTGNIYL